MSISTVATIFPVFFMLGLGMASRKFKWISPANREGINNFIFTVLFPIMIFNLMLTASIESQHLLIVAYVSAAYMLSMVVGKALTFYTGKEYAHLSPYLLPTNEGGSVALPLYLSIVGASSNTVIFDIAGSIACFVVMPIIVQRQVSGSADIKSLIRNMLTNSFILAVIFGLGLNALGFYNMLMSMPVGEVYTATISMATGPITGCILFGIGYDLQIDKNTLIPVLKMMSVKFVYSALIIAGFFLLFSGMMADKEFLMAVLIYFMCPTGFGLLPILSPMYKNKNDAAYASAFTSLYMFITLTVYVLVVVMIA